MSTTASRARHSFCSSMSPYHIDHEPARRRYRPHCRRRHLMHMIAPAGNVSDCDEANSSCGEDDYFVTERRNSTPIKSGGVASAPLSSVKLKELFERIQQEIQKLKRKCHFNPKSCRIHEIKLILLLQESTANPMFCQ